MFKELEPGCKPKRNKDIVSLYDVFAKNNLYFHKEARSLKIPLGILIPNELNFKRTVEFEFILFFTLHPSLVKKGLVLENNYCKIEKDVEFKLQVCSQFDDVTIEKGESVATFSILKNYASEFMMLEI